MKHIPAIVPVVAVLLALGAFLWGMPFVFAYEVDLPSIPGTDPRGGPAQFVQYLFILGLGLGGILAFGMIVFAGLEWSLSGANPSLQEDAKDRIRNAIFGLILLLGAYVILNTINPDIVALRQPSLRGLEVPAPREPQAPRNDGIPPPYSEGGPSPVTPFGPPDPMPLNIADMDDEAEQSLRNMLACDDRRLDVTVQVLSAFRPQAYQDHLKELYCKQKCAIEGIQLPSLPSYCRQYINFPCTPGRYEPRYNAAIANINTEWSRHGGLNQPADRSRHTLGCAVDMNVSGINPNDYGFFLRIGYDSPTHYEHVFCPEANRVYNPPCQ